MEEEPKSGRSCHKRLLHFPVHRGSDDGLDIRARILVVVFAKLGVTFTWDHEKEEEGEREKSWEIHCLEA